MSKPCLLKNEIFTIDVSSHQCFSLYMVDINGHREVWASGSLSLFSSPYSLICFIFYPLMWLMGSPVVQVSEEGEVPLRPSG